MTNPTQDPPVDYYAIPGDPVLKDGIYEAISNRTGKPVGRLPFCEGVVFPCWPQDPPGCDITWSRDPVRAWRCGDEVDAASL